VSSFPDVCLFAPRGRPIEKPPPALESVSPQGGCVACPVRNKTCVPSAVTAALGAWLFKLRAKSVRAT
jgi:hypothetical protein